MKNKFTVVYVALGLISLFATVSAVLIDRKISSDNNYVWFSLIIIVLVSQSLSVFIHRKLDNKNKDRLKLLMEL